MRGAGQKSSPRTVRHLSADTSRPASSRRSFTNASAAMSRSRRDSVEPAARRTKRSSVVDGTYDDGI